MMATKKDIGNDDGNRINKKQLPSVAAVANDGNVENLCVIMVYLCMLPTLPINTIKVFFRDYEGIYKQKHDYLLICRHKP
ncbi:MAG: hypothetical protein KIB45_06145 [Negativicoccus succinicivorans]|nr:hypothetical protein [Negativicoccus succinicivorans]